MRRWASRSVANYLRSFADELLLPLRDVITHRT